MSGALEREYRVGEEIGRGKFGVVSRCHSAVTGQCFAVKSIDKRLIRDDAVDSLCISNEAKLMQLVSGHPNVLGIFDVYEDEDFLHVVLEYCGSGDLLERISARPVFVESEARRVMVSSSLFIIFFINFIFEFGESEKAEVKLYTASADRTLYSFSA